MMRKIYRILKESSPPYWVTIFIAIFSFGLNFGVERLMDRLKSYDTSISELRGASGEFIALGGAFALPIINKEKPDPDLRSEFSKNIMKQIAITNELKEKLPLSSGDIAEKYIDELEKTKILLDRTSNFEDLQALYQRYAITRAAWKRLNKVL